MCPKFGNLFNSGFDSSLMFFFTKMILEEKDHRSVRSLSKRFADYRKFILRKNDIKIDSIKSTAQKMKLSIKDFFNKYDNQICKKLRIWSHLLKKSFVESFIFCAVKKAHRYCPFASLKWSRKLYINQAFLTTDYKILLPPHYL